jgi:PTH1 family peptidyl-tRNA hydrolase
MAVRALAGLGNPGRKYSNTRHNIGFLVADELALRYGAAWSGKFNGDHCKVRLRNHDLEALKPGTYMNLSGHPVQALCRFFGVKPDELLVVHDDLDLPWGRVAVKDGGGHGGHNGLRSIVEQLGSNAFARVRVGIGRPEGNVDPADWVLSPWSGGEKAELSDVVDRAVRAVEAVVETGVQAAMNACNGRAKAAT